MEIQELNKKQMVLLVLLITFVVSIATGIVTVSLMQKVPKNVPQMVNNVIERTIEKVTLQAPTPDTKSTTNTDTKTTDTMTFTDENVQVSIYDNKEILKKETNTSPVNTNTTNSTNTEIQNKELGKGIILSDIGLVLVDSSILNEDTLYKVVLNKKEFDANVIQKFTNGFTILKISTKKDKLDTSTTENTNEATKTNITPKITQ